MDELETFDESGTTSRRGLLRLGGMAALGTAVAGAMMGSGTAYGASDTRGVAVPKTTGDFQLASHFSVEIDGVVVAGVHTVDIETESTIPNDPTSPPINTLTVTKDWSNTSEWYKWRKTVLDGKVDRRTVTVIFRNAAGVETSRMNFFECWPTKWVGPSMNSLSSAHAQVRLVLSWNTAN